jgi:hypothetical protein
MILAHWRSHLPQMIADLEARHQLEQALSEAQEKTEDLLYELLSVQKLDYQTAWEIATREWAFLPSEDHPPSLPTSTPIPQ